MNVSVVTSCSIAGWNQYGRRFVETFDKFWPADIPLYVVSEDALPCLPDHGGRKFVPLDLNLSTEFAAFSNRHKSNARAHGLRAGMKATVMDKRHGYNFKMDAVRFSKKVFAVGMATQLVPAGRLIWLDADVVTIDYVPHKFLSTLPPDNYAVAYLGRKNYHSECGFVSYNLDHPATRPFIDRYVGTYTTDKVFKLSAWDDCAVFDHVRAAKGVPSFSISSPTNYTHHPFVHSPLGQYMDHLKGRRKGQASSPEHPVLRGR